MPEGPEVRKYADALDEVLSGRVIVSLEARTREARKWLEQNEQQLIGRRVERVVSHGKHLIGYISGDFFFHSHLMMWGRWQTFAAVRRGRSKSKTLSLPDKDRRERARVVVEGGAAILLSAPIFNVGHGDPYHAIEILATLGPDALPYRGRFDRREFQRRLFLPQHQDETIGASLLNQQIVAGLGNYLRAEILFNCNLNPWLTVRELTKRNVSCLTRSIPQLAGDAYTRGATATDTDRERMASDPALVYQPGREYGTRHLVFRRTNLPCLRCGETIRQLRQRTSQSDDDETERTRIVYFCAQCQGVKISTHR
ncbi:MAG TPA: DNA-formamidopyrimidine glycosylase family protein [Pyrinomonadaceae bacterium]|nr:DNA-formamidopyrimidine glycosylase family protein [Pyrinomonadaceae bacterium]